GRRVHQADRPRHPRRGGRRRGDAPDGAPLGRTATMMPWLRADARGIYTIWYRDVIRFWRDRSRIVASLWQPVLFLLIFGTALGSLVGTAARGSFGGAVS